MRDPGHQNATWTQTKQTCAMFLDKLRVFYFALHGVLALLIDAQAIAPDVSDGLVQMYERNDLATIV